MKQYYFIYTHRNHPAIFPLGIFNDSGKAFLAVHENDNLCGKQGMIVDQDELRNFYVDIKVMLLNHRLINAQGY